MTFSASSKVTQKIVLWVRRDLRLSDHPALSEAIESGAEIIPVFIWAPEEEAPWSPGEASNWWLHHSLKSFEKDLSEKGSCLIVRRGPSLQALREILVETGSTSVFFSRLIEPKIMDRDLQITQTLSDEGFTVRSFGGHLLLRPEEFRNQQGKAFQVFTPFWKAALAKGFSLEVNGLPENIRGPRQWPKSLKIEELQLRPNIRWDQEMAKAWNPGEKNGRTLYRSFLESAIREYQTKRDIPFDSGTSRLSPYLHFGEVSVREVFRAAEIVKKKTAAKLARASIETFQRELGWREFAHYLLFHFPLTSDQPLRENFKKFPWVKDDRYFKSWCNGKTGFPIIDAGMRELWATGWMHNRVRMIVASFLTKDLRISWLEGARWFWDTLVDADLASNTLGWQWAGGCGADAAPYFRIFNPDSQTEKFDPEQKYIRRWVQDLDAKSYPRPIVDHKLAREEALRAFSSMKEKG